MPKVIDSSHIEKENTMSTTEIRIITSNEVFVVNDENQISRPSLTREIGAPWGMPSDNWRLTGAVEYRTVFGRWVIVRSFSVQDIRERLVPWKYKNGKQRCFITDFDHGSGRVWMNPDHYCMTVSTNDN